MTQKDWSVTKIIIEDIYRETFNCFANIPRNLLVENIDEFFTKAKAFIQFLEKEEFNEIRDDPKVVTGFPLYDRFLALVKANKYEITLDKKQDKSLRKLFKGVVKLREDWENE